MSVLVALTGSDCSLVATDSRRVESDGAVRDDYSKTFRLTEVFTIGGHTGLLEFSGRTIPAWMQTLPLSSIQSLDDLVVQAKALLEAQMSCIAQDEVGFPHRRADIVLVAHAQLKQKKSPVLIRAIVLRPDEATNRVIGEVRSFSGYCATGDDAAMNSVRARIRTLRPHPQMLPRKRLDAAAKQLIDVGVRSAHPHPAFPATCSCGGPPSIVFL